MAYELEDKCTGYKSYRCGETNKNKQGCNMKIIEYNRNNDVTIEFEDGVILRHRDYRCFADGTVMNYNYPTVYGVGYLGYGEYNSKKDKKVHDVWSKMIQRCYNKTTINKYPSYKGCCVSNEFLNFQNFAKFYYDNKWTDDLVLIPDKDILTHGKNKIYSRETIIFVDNRINVLFTKRDAKRGLLPIGTHKAQSGNKFISNCCKICDDGLSRSIYLGRFNTPEEAFYAYKEFKEKYIKQVADEYKDKYENFPQKLYDAMYSYKIDIKD